MSVNDFWDWYYAFFTHRRHFLDLSEQATLALAIYSKEDDVRIFRTFSEILKAYYGATSEIFGGMAKEEDGHRQRLIDLYLQRFGDHVQLIRQEHVAGFYTRRPI
jgi:rubrerythrin